MCGMTCETERSEKGQSCHEKSSDGVMEMKSTKYIRLCHMMCVQRSDSRVADEVRLSGVRPE
jgi:hypothetical protein